MVTENNLKDNAKKEKLVATGSTTNTQTHAGSNKQCKTTTMKRKTVVSE